MLVLNEAEQYGDCEGQAHQKVTSAVTKGDGRSYTEKGQSGGQDLFIGIKQPANRFTYCPTLFDEPLGDLCFIGLRGWLRGRGEPRRLLWRYSGLTGG